ncbi:MAG: acetyltransferase [Monoraphidium minutum]|nr:MAG: acetyltransferase [Monoraphidium minutum]
MIAAQRLGGFKSASLRPSSRPVTLLRRAAMDGSAGASASGAAAPAAAPAAGSSGAPAAAPPPYVLLHAEGREQLRDFAGLTREYYEWLGEDLCFQGIDQELASLPGCYAPPAGAIILAARPAAGGGAAAAGDAAALEPVGCVAVRPLAKEDDGGGGGGGAPAPVCEMKRLYVRGGDQGAGLGAALVAAAVAAGRELGYKSIVLDTLERLGAANRIYEAAGFRRRGAYYHNPLPNVVYWELDL